MFAVVAALSTGCATGGRAGGAPALTAAPRVQTGTASFYGRGHHGKLTASGERFDMNAMTAAHPSLPFGTRVRVTNLRTGKTVVVRINDRGPHARGRIIDLSKAAARKLGFVGPGVAQVRIEVVS